MHSRNSSTPFMNYQFWSHLQDETHTISVKFFSQKLRGNKSDHGHDEVVDTTEIGQLNVFPASANILDLS
uniref:Putative ovule protein n=1 Tax=Solanum chacoense TaxID=4108 RepID=A0A0V0H631_SOLCH